MVSCQHNQTALTRPALRCERIAQRFFRQGQSPAAEGEIACIERAARAQHCQFLTRIADSAVGMRMVRAGLNRGDRGDDVRLVLIAEAFLMALPPKAATQEQ